MAQNLSGGTQQKQPVNHRTKAMNQQCTANKQTNQNRISPDLKGLRTNFLSFSLQLCKDFQLEKIIQKRSLTSARAHRPRTATRHPNLVNASPTISILRSHHSQCVADQRPRQEQDQQPAMQTDAVTPLKLPPTWPNINLHRRNEFGRISASVLAKSLPTTKSLGVSRAGRARRAGGFSNDLSASARTSNWR